MKNVVRVATKGMKDLQVMTAPGITITDIGIIVLIRSVIGIINVDFR